ncbi:MAG: methyltransferase domain-containing protein [Phormidium sp.]
MNYLNLGCGYRFHPDWTNVDFVSTGEGVIAHNFIKGIPFHDSSFDVIYHSHLLEHFSKKEAESFLRDCYRVLRPQGVLRVAVPDLEQTGIILIWIQNQMAQFISQTLYLWKLLNHPYEKYKYRKGR